MRFDLAQDRKPILTAYQNRHGVEEKTTGVECIQEKTTGSAGCGSSLSLQLEKQRTWIFGDNLWNS